MASILPASFATHAQSLIQRIQRGPSAVELVHIPHERWPLPLSRSPLASAPHPRRLLNISVLDSSFNPPTRAHLALARLQPPRSWQNASDVHNFDAKLLLLSVSNADKQLKPGDASYVQRLEMMALLARELASKSTNDDDSNNSENDNVAVAIIDEPTFVGKSHKLLDFLNARISSLIDTSTGHALLQPRLTFLMGFDTLERLFAPRYYGHSEENMFQALRSFFLPTPSPSSSSSPSSLGGDGSRVLCAHRALEAYPSSSTSTSEAETLGLAREFMDADALTLVDIGEDESRFSSSEVRRGVKNGDPDWRRLVTEEIAGYIQHDELYIS